jgi:hypothetical protein
MHLTPESLPKNNESLAMQTANCKKKERKAASLESQNLFGDIFEFLDLLNSQIVAAKSQQFESEPQKF